MSNNNTIVIYGMTRTGKNTLGKELAEKEGYRFIDIESNIEAILNQRIKDYEKKGEREKRFNLLETQTIERSLKKPGKKIISIRLGSIESEKTRKLIFKYADKIIHICSDRKEIYQNSYDFIIQNNGNIETVIQALSEKINIGNICIPINNFEEKNLIKVFEEIKTIPTIKFVELRIDSLIDKTRLNEIIKQCPKRVIVTNRHNSESGNFEGSFEESIEILSQVEGASYIDIEIKAGKKINKLQEKLKMKNIGLITSYHNFKETESLETLKNKLEEMEKYSPDVYKIAMRPQSEEDVMIIYRLTEHFKKNYEGKDFIFISMGELGKQTRIDIPKAGGLISFRCIGNQGTAPGQIPV